MSRNAVVGRSTGSKCHSLPDKKVECKIGSCKCRLRQKTKRQKCVCAKALLKKKILTPQDIFDELGNYKYCTPVLASLISPRKFSEMRNLLTKKIAELMPDYRYATARTILKYKLENFICGDLPEVSDKKCIRVALQEIADEDDYLIKLRLVDRKPSEPEKFSIIPYSSCTTPFHLLYSINIASLRYRLLENFNETESEELDDSSDSPSDEDEFTATANLKFWDDGIPHEMTIENISIDVEKCVCNISFSIEDYENFIAKKQRTQ
jgi:hypothetical protein